MLLAGGLLAAFGGTVLARAPAEPVAQQACPAAPGGVVGPTGKTIINPPGLSDPSGSGYSHGVRVGNMVYLAGETGAAPGLTEPLNLETQTRRAFAKMQTILEAAGGSLDDLVTMTVFITDIRNAQEFTQLRAEILGRDFPGSALIGVSRLVTPDALLEIQGVAVLRCS
jgi:enamine deaminase RidA (YjgF/YER057c/UK114 family)